MDPVGVFNSTDGNTYLVEAKLRLTTEMKNAILNSDKKLDRGRVASAYLAYIDPFAKEGWNFSLHPSLADAIDARYYLLKDNKVPAVDYTHYGNLMDLV